MTFSQVMKQAACQYGIELTEQQLTAFDQYYQLLVEWNAKMNLTAITEPEEVAVKHMIDSLSCYKPDYFPPGCTVADVGTGAGFPGIPLKIIRPDIKLALLDSLQKRLTFLQVVTDRLGLANVDIVHIRAEDAGRQKQFREKFQIVLARAVARLNVLCEYCLPLVQVGGHFIALKGAQYSEEIKEAANAVKILGGEVAEVYNVVLPGLEDARAVIYFNKNKVTSAGYPRRTGLPEKKPL